MSSRLHREAIASPVRSSYMCSLLRKDFGGLNCTLYPMRSGVIWPLLMPISLYYQSSIKMSLIFCERLRCKMAVICLYMAKEMLQHSPPKFSSPQKDFCLRLCCNANCSLARWSSEDIGCAPPVEDSSSWPTVLAIPRNLLLPGLIKVKVGRPTGSKGEGRRSGEHKQALPKEI